MSGVDGERAVPFFQHMCVLLGTAATDGSLPVTNEEFESMLVAMSTALCELLKRQQRARLHDDLPNLLASVDNTTDVVINGPSIARQLVTRRIEDMRATIARARGYVSENANVNSEQQHVPLSTYPRAIQMPHGRHDNDKTDITKMSIYPTLDEIMSVEVEFLPSTDPDQPHYLTDKAERHIDTNFRLLRHDTFGELKIALATLMENVSNDPLSLQNTKVGLEDIRAYPYIDACVDGLVFRSRDGLRAQISFAQPSQVQTKTAVETDKWWEDSKRMTDGVLLSFIWVDGTGVHHLFLTTARVNDREAPTGTESDDHKRKTVWTKLATQDQSTVRSLVAIDCSKAKGLLLEYPNIIPGTFVPILENLQNMQRLSRLPFREWILPERADSTYLDIPAPLYAQRQGFSFSLRSIQQPTDPIIHVHPDSPLEDDTLVNDIVNKTELDHGQSRALLAALSREFAFIQGPPGTGKSYLGIKMMKVLLDTKEKAKLGPIIVV
jgi:hypothetical protein